MVKLDNFIAYSTQSEEVEEGFKDGDFGGIFQVRVQDDGEKNQVNDGNKNLQLVLISRSFDSVWIKVGF